jgi:hypothetical protein
MSTSRAQIAANQANAQLSTGPKTAAGKAKSSLNAVSTGLTGKTVLLPHEDAQVYSDHIASFIARYNPSTPEEREIVQELAQTKWRLLRVPQLEEDLYALGAVTFAAMFEDQPEEIRPGLIRAHTFVTYGKRFDNLYLQESRLGRRYSALLKRLAEITLQRQTEEIDRIAAARIAPSNPPERTGRSVPVIRDSADIGFEFSTSAALYPDRPFSSLSPAEKAEVERARAAAKRNR